mmetsp:Transcript_5035/g.10735  ORF Transcript_5035/g.10735 Transcript_5035/m.10735 type:complete len:239 (+) Transcript_5035:248-964(+)
MPVPDRSDRDHFYSPKDARDVIERENLSHNDLIGYIPDAKTDTAEKKLQKEAAKLDKPNRSTFNATKVRAVATCDSCGAKRAVYSKNAVGQKGGPTKRQLENVETLLECGYVCGNPLGEGLGFLMRRALNCGDYIETQYYTPSSGLKGGRIRTEDICAICYGEDEIVSADVIRKEKDTKGRNPLPICRFCFDNNTELPVTGGRVNMMEKSVQQAAKKNKLHIDAVRRGRKKARKESSS